MPSALSEQGLFADGIFAPCYDALGLGAGSAIGKAVV